MRSYKIKDINRYLIIILVFILALFIIGIAYADDDKGNEDKINAKPGAVQFRVDIPVSEVSANNVLEFSRHRGNEHNVYYRVIDNSGFTIDLSEYIMAKTPYYSDFQSLDKPVLFLAREDDFSRIYLKFRVDNYLWEYLPDGKYKLELVSDRGKSVKIHIHVKKASYMTVYPDNINIFADNGPGKYQSKDSVIVYINNMNNKWNLDISATPLIYQGKGENVPVVEKSDIYVSINDRNNFVSLNYPCQLSGEKYGNTTPIELFFQVEVGHEYYAGDYKGQVFLTIFSQ